MASRGEVNAAPVNALPAVNDSAFFYERPFTVLAGLSWDVRMRVTSNAPLNWNVRHRVSASSSYEWKVGRTAQTVRLPIRWHVGHERREHVSIEKWSFV